MSGIRVEGATSGNVAEVTASNELKVQNNNGVQTTNLYGEPFEVGNNGRVRQSPENHILQDPFVGSSLNTNIWTPSTSGMTQALSGGAINMNSGNAATANAYSIINSILQPAYWSDFSNYFHARIQATPQNHSVIEFGWGVVATNGAPTDGVFFRITGTGVMSVVMSYGGVETSLAASGPINSADVYEIQLEIIDDHIKWYVADANNNLYFTDGNANNASNPLFGPATQMEIIQLANDQHMPVFFRVYNDSTGPSSAPAFKVGYTNFIQRDVVRNKTWGEVMAAMGRGAYQGPAQTSLIQTANHANSSSPTSASLSNTAAGYTTLGGRYQFAAPAGAATDFCLFGFQVPANFQFTITNISISAINTGAAVASTATILDWSIAVNSSAVSLATTESPPTSWAPRRVPLGTQGFIVGAAIGATASDIVRDFRTPLVCDSGRFVQVIVQVPVGTATASQVIRGDVMINGYFE